MGSGSDSPKGSDSPRSYSRKASRLFRLPSRLREYEVLEEQPTVIETVKSTAEKARNIYFPTKEETKGYTFLDWFGVFLPCVVWLRTYDVKHWLWKDVVAGLSVGAMVIPQGMSYANLAGLPYVFGLYGAFVPCLVYSLFGSSRQLAVGPVAVTSMILGTGLSNMFDFVNADPNNPTDPQAQLDYNHAAVQVAFIAGLMYTAVGLLRLGWLTNFLSHTVVSGFMSGACIVIALSQVKYILGLKYSGRPDTFEEAMDLIWGNITTFQWREFVMGMAFIFLLLAFRFLGGRYKKLSILKALGPLTVCVLSIAIMNIFDLYDTKCNGKQCIKPIGNIPKGMPPFTPSWFFPLFNVGKQITLSIIICLVDICESISIARAMAIKNQYRLNPTQELRGLGYANLAGSFFSCYTTTGSFSRSAINNSVGAKTLLSSFTTGILLMITLLVLTPVFKNMSQNVQGAVIIVGVLQLFDYSEWLYLWKINKLDWLVWNITWLVVLFAGVEIGIGVGIGVSLLLVIYKSAFPHIAQLGRLPESTIYRNVKMYPGAQAPPGILVLRVDAPIYYANVENLRDYILNEVQQHQELQQKGGERVRFLVLDLAPVTDVDATGVHFMNDIIRLLDKEGVKLVLANPTRKVLAALRRAELIKKIGFRNVHVDVHAAVESAQQQLTEQIKKETVEGV